jgi:hypothetical protein
MIDNKEGIMFQIYRSKDNNKSSRSMRSRN